jgi:hypothetical protein
LQSAIKGRLLACFVTQLTALGILATAVSFLSRRYALLAVLLAVTFSDFLDQSFRIRADVFSTMFALPAFYVVCSPRLGRTNMMLAGLGLGLAMATTQKAIYFVIAFGVAVSVRCLFDLKSSPIVTSIRAIVSLGAAAACGAAVPVAGLVVSLVTTGCWQGFLEQGLLHGARAGLVADTYVGTVRYVWQSLYRNPVFWSLGLSGAVGMLVRSFGKQNPDGTSQEDQGRRSREIGLGVWTATLLLLFWQHKVKFPYIFVNLTPCLAMCGAWTLTQFGQTMGRGRWPGWLMASCLGGLAAALLHIWPHYERNLNNPLLTHQASVMLRVDSITSPNDAVFDGVGMATTRVHAVPWSLTMRFFDERKAGANYPIIPYLLERQPKVAIENYRWTSLSNEEKAYLETHFVRDWSNVLVAGHVIQHRSPERTEHTIHIGAEADYAVLAEKDARVTIDGVVVPARVHLSTGMHNVTVEGEPGTILLKYARAVDTRGLSPLEPQNLYPSYSD